MTYAKAGPRLRSEFLPHSCWSVEHIHIEYLTRSDRDMSLKMPFCRPFLEHLDLTFTNETLQATSRDYDVPFETKIRSEKGHTTDF